MPLPSRGQPLTHPEERALGAAIRAAEDRMRGVLAAFPVCAPALGVTQSRRYSTHSWSLTRLEAGLAALRASAEADPTARAAALEAARHWERSEALRWRLALSQLRVAHRLAKEIGGAHRPVEDLVHDGILGLLEAARRFDPERGLRFVTYARWWVRAQITVAIDRGGRLVRLPGNVAHDARRIRRILAQARQVDHAATVAEVAERLALPVAYVVDLLHHVELSFEPVPPDEEDRPDLELADGAAPADAALVTREERASALAAIGHLPAAHRRVLEARFGLKGQEPGSLAEIARRDGMSREGVRQRELHAIAAVRHELGLPSRGAAPPAGTPAARVNWAGRSRPRDGAERSDATRPGSRRA